MTKSTITREQLEEWVAQFDEDGGCDATDRQLEALIRQSLAAMDSEPVAFIDKQWALVYYVPPMSMGLKIGDKLYRHAQPVPELKPVGYLFISDQGAIVYSPTDWGMLGFRLVGQIYGDIDVESQPAPVVPDGYVMVPKEMTDEIGKAIAMQANCCGGIALDIYDAMIAATKHDTHALNSVQSVVTVPGKWIPVSERMPDVGVKVLCFPAKDEPIHATFNGQLWLQDVSWSGSEEPIDNVIPVTVTHWMPLPAGPQEVR